MFTLNSNEKKILNSMRTKDKVALLTGKDLWTTVELLEHNIGALKVSDGPAGVRGDSKHKGSSVSLPCPAALGATWNKDLVFSAGHLLGKECKRKSVSLLLGPTINLQRTPIGGRNFECYSEDAYLTSQLAVEFVNGVQTQPGVGACIKHFVCNDQEYERMKIDIHVDENILRELYLSPFEQVVKQAKPWAVMSSYNRVNGKYLSSHTDLLVDVLKNEWGFDGIVVSDWFAKLDDDNFHLGALGGLDLEMPGPTRVWGEKLVDACEQNVEVMQAVDDKAGRMIRLLLNANRMTSEPFPVEISIDDEQESQLAKQIACEASVLIKNETNILPLASAKIRKLAIIGPNAIASQIQGGGSVKVNPHRSVNILQGIQSQIDSNPELSHIQLHHSLGCMNNKWVPMPTKGRLRTDSEGGEIGFSGELFSDKLCTESIDTRRFGSAFRIFTGCCAQ